MLSFTVDLCFFCWVGSQDEEMYMVLCSEVLVLGCGVFTQS